MTKNIAAVRRQTKRDEEGQHKHRERHRGTSGSQATLPSPDPVVDERDRLRRKKLYQYDDESSVWAPGVSTVFKILVSLRMSAGIWSPIADCDETFNYWEPLHFLLYGSGLQTWEYSPVYAIRSYAYVWLHTIPVRIFQFLLPHTKVTTFFYLRCFLGFLSSLAEVYLYRAICRRFGNSIGRLYVTFTGLSAGMFIASCALLPSSFTMIFTTASIAFWLEDHMLMAIFCVATSALVGWPFAAITGLPIVLDYVFEQKRTGRFIGYSLFCGWAICTSLVAADSHYYGKWVLAPLNIVLYNVFTSHGPSLYGTEPLSFYLINLSLNWNLAWPLALASFAIAPIVFKVSQGRADWSRFRPLLFLQLTLLAWLLIFFSQPHKEERFLYPVYPLICICGAVGLDGLKRVLSAAKNFMFANSCTAGAVFAFLLLSGSRSLAIYRNYHAPFDSYMSLSERISNSSEDSNLVCVGKEWYRYPGSFFLPRNAEIGFLKSEFRGLLPKPYAKLPLPEATRLIPTEMNDMNREETSRYVSEDECDYIVDLETPDTSPLEPNYAASSMWEVIHKEPFLLSHRSDRLFRAFYVPILSDKFCFMGRYVVLKRARY